MSCPWALRWQFCKILGSEIQINLDTHSINLGCFKMELHILTFSSISLLSLILRWFRLFRWSLVATGDWPTEILSKPFYGKILPSSWRSKSVDGWGLWTTPIEKSSFTSLWNERANIKRINRVFIKEWAPKVNHRVWTVLWLKIPCFALITNIISFKLS